MSSLPPSRGLIKIFGIVGLINFIIFYLLWNYLLQEEYSNIPLRIIAAFLCFLLVISDLWPKKTQRYLIYFWYFTICYCLPFFGTYMFLINNASPTWSSNIIIGLFWLVLITDWKSFLINLTTGIIAGTIYYKISYGEIYITTTNMLGTYSNYIWSIVIAVVFSRQKELLFKTHQLNLLNKANIKLEEALSVKTEFLNNLSHEIRTPVHGFTVISNGLIHNWNQFDNDKKFKLAQAIADNANRFGSLVENLFNLSSFINNEVALNLEKFKLSETLDKVVLECNTKNLTNKRNITSSYKNKFNNSTEVTADRDKISQVLYNLLTNAIKFTPNDGVINISLSLSQEDIHFEISDNGLGIPREESTTIFEPFSQSTRTKTGAGGRGIGLSICKQIIEAHHGKIWVDNSFGPGANLQFTIPINQ